MNDDATIERTSSLSVAIEDAWTTMRRMLFAPFDIGKWFVLGFSAWLATLGENGFSSGGNAGSNWDSGSAHDHYNGASAFFHEYMGIIIAVAAVVLLFMIVVGLVMLWVRSRGKFMLLDNVVHNRAEIVKPWSAYRTEANSLFVWQLLFSIVSLIVVLVIVGGGVLLAMPSISSGHFGADAVVALAVGIPLILLWALVATVVVILLNDFVIPIMYIRRARAVGSWRIFLGLWRERFWSFLLYLLVRLGLVIGINMAIIALILLTCCCALIIMAIPYIGTVFLLPVLIFLRAFSVCYLRQYGPDFDVFPGPPPLPGGGQV